MKHFEELEEFIKNENNWIEKLKNVPYSLKTIQQFPINENWYLLMYNLFESDLSNPIVKQCRGSVVEVIENNGEREVKVICAPFLKFFNWNEEHSDFHKIDWSNVTVFDKRDGQICKMFKYEGVDYWLTNGSTGLNTPLDYTTASINNYKDLVAKALMEPYIGKDSEDNVSYSQYSFNANLDWVKKVPDGYTLMFELTSPQNRIIVKYDKIKISLIGCRDNEGNEITVEKAKELFGIPYDTPKVFKDIDTMDNALDLLSKMNGLEQEGIVICDNNFNRVKVKCDSYLRLKFVRGCDTPKNIFSLVINEDYDDILPVAYDGLKEKILKQIEDLNSMFKLLNALKDHAKITSNLFKSRKEFALWVQESVKKELSWIYFAGCNDKDIIKIAKEKFKSDNGYEKYELYKELLKI